MGGPVAEGVTVTVETEKVRDGRKSRQITASREES